MFRSRPLHTVVCCLTMTLPLAACGHAEARRLRAVAGTYVYRMEMHGTHVRREVTLQPDGRWTMRLQADAGGQPMVDAAASGTFTLDGVTLALRSPDTDELMQYTVSGDTLRLRRAREVALAKAVTGIDLSGEEEFLVRRR